MKVKKVYKIYYSNFERNGGILKGANIGKRVIIEEWFKEWAPDTNYEIDNSLNIIINENLNLFKCHIIEFLNNIVINSLIIKGYLDLSFSKIKILPKNLKKINGTLWLNNTSIEEIPDNLEIEGFLTLYNTKIKKLAKNLKIKKSLFIENTLIKELPDDLDIGENIYISKDQNIKCPEHLKNKLRI